MLEREDIERVAENARINLEEEEIEQFKEEFNDILEAFSALDDIDTEGVEPAQHPIEQEERKRKDKREECLERDEVFQNSENKEKGYFKGPKVK